MRLGILNAFPEGTSRVNWNDTPVDAYIRLLESADAPLNYLGYEVAKGEFPVSNDDCDAYLVTGSPKAAYDPDEWIGTLLQFIRDAYQAGKRLVGICFGHQALAHALGGHAEKSEKGWGLGLKPFDIVEKKAWMTGEPDSCSLYFIHQDQVSQLPAGAELLGGNAFCPNALYTVDQRLLGIQGHPEFTASIMKELLDLRKERFGPRVYQMAADSLDSGTPDNRLVAHWIVNFLMANP